MHGIVEVIAFYVFLGTFLGAFALRMSNSARSAPVMLLIGCWPLLFGLATEGRDFFAEPAPWLFGVAITLPAMWLGSRTAVAMLRWRAKRSSH